MESLLAVAALIMVLAYVTLPAAALAQAPPTAGRPAKSAQEINITSDSQPGWVPSAQQMQQVRLAIDSYLSALDGGRYKAAYGMLTQRTKAILPFEKFSGLEHDFYRQSGRLLQRRLLRTTWTKYPVTSPNSGVYAAVDFAGRFDNIDRQCGYVVLFQGGVSRPFEVMRSENNFITNDMAAKQKSRADLNRQWTKLAANCPNYSLPTSP